MNLNTFRAFSSRNFRLYITGQSISLIGTWMQRTAVYWLIYTQTHSAFMLGVAVLRPSSRHFYSLRLAG